MIVGKPKRKFIIRIIDVESGKSKNISIYNTDLTIDEIYEIVEKCLRA